MMRVDAHQHYWALVRGDYDWISSARPIINRDFLPVDLKPLLAQNSVAQTVLVQSTPTLAETKFLLTLAENEASIAGVVGWVDLASPSACDLLEQLARYKKFLGIRMMAQPETDPDWLAQPAFTSALEKLATLEKSLDILALEAHLPALEILSARHANLRIVLNHAAKPAISDGAFTSWSAALRRLAQNPNTFCKLSGLTALARPEFLIGDLAPYFDEVIAAYGPKRTIWGSDWPVLNESSSYDTWMKITNDLLAPLPQDERDQILSGTAISAYRLPKPTSFQITSDHAHLITSHIRRHKIV